MEMWRCEIRGEKVEVGEVGELALTNHSPYYILFFFFFGGFFFLEDFYFYFSLNPFPPFLHIIVVVSPVSCLFLVDHL